MDFPGSFKDHILPDKIHILNISFTINTLKESFGGTAGNIAYNLSLLGERPKILSLAGDDFGLYAKWLKKKKIDISLVKKYKDFKTASAYIITDKDDNQIAGFYPGPKDDQYTKIANKQKNISFAIIAPDNKERMLSYAQVYKANKTKYIFDPGQATPAFSKSELLQTINGAEVLIGNDYEIQLILDKLKITMDKLNKLAKMVITTKGDKGSEISFENKIIKINPVKPTKTLDPTGAGDAYRAGLIKGLIAGLNLEQVGQLASTVAVYAVEQYGTQNHRFSLKDIRERYRENYGEQLSF
jgi:adenosine kinase